MYVGVLLHIALLVKTFAAITAWIRPRIAVYQQMCRQRAGAFETLAALFALENLLHIVYSSISERESKREEISENGLTVSQTKVNYFMQTKSLYAPLSHRLKSTFKSHITMAQGCNAGSWCYIWFLI